MINENRILSRREWTNNLKEPYKSQVILNSGICDLENRSSICGFLISAFSWSSSPEGFDYWNKIHANVSDNINLDKYFKIEPKEISYDIW